MFCVELRTRGKKINMIIIVRGTLHKLTHLILQMWLQSVYSFVLRGEYSVLALMDSDSDECYQKILINTHKPLKPDLCIHPVSSRVNL